MPEDELIQPITVITLTLSVLMMVIIIARIISRIFRIRRRGDKIPPALWKDLVLWGGLGIIVIVPLANNYLGGENLLNNLLWAIIRSAVSLFVMGVQVFFEVLYIDKDVYDDSNGN